MQFDLDEWQRLAREDPSEFERRRQAAIESFISQAPAEHRDRLRGLQFRIDLERRRAKTALGAALRLQSMMWERFGQLGDALAALAMDTPSTQPTAARILPFRKPD